MIGGYFVLLSLPNSRPVDILCGPDQVEHLTGELSRHGVQFSTMIEDVQKLAEMAPMTKGTKNR